nr:actin-like protein [Ipomoea trifida]
MGSHLRMAPEHPVLLTEVPLNPKAEIQIKDASIFPMDFTLLRDCVATGGLLGGGRVGNVLWDSFGDGAEQ